MGQTWLTSFFSSLANIQAGELRIDARAKVCLLWVRFHSIMVEVDLNQSRLALTLRFKLLDNTASCYDFRVGGSLFGVIYHDVRHATIWVNLLQTLSTTQWSLALPSLCLARPSSCSLLGKRNNESPPPPPPILPGWKYCLTHVNGQTPSPQCL